jgi:hypothetical protein
MSRILYLGANPGQKSNVAKLSEMLVQGSSSPHVNHVVGSKLSPSATDGPPRITLALPKSLSLPPSPQFTSAVTNERPPLNYHEPEALSAFSTIFHNFPQFSTICWNRFWVFVGFSSRFLGGSWIREDVGEIGACGSFEGEMRVSRFE